MKQKLSTKKEKLLSVVHFVNGDSMTEKYLFCKEIYFIKNQSELVAKKFLDWPTNFYSPWYLLE